MGKKLMGKNIEPRCIYCTHGFIGSDSKSVVCFKKGVMKPDDRCPKFKYDALKRVPLRPTLQTDFSEDDFKL